MRKSVYIVVINSTFVVARTSRAKFWEIAFACGSYVSEDLNEATNVNTFTLTV